MLSLLSGFDTAAAAALLQALIRVQRTAVLLVVARCEQTANRCCCTHEVYLLPGIPYGHAAVPSCTTVCLPRATLIPVTMFVLVRTYVLSEPNDAIMALITANTQHSTARDDV